MKNKFSIEKHELWDKSFGVSSDELYLSVDYDDVDHPEVDAAVKTMVTILNENWDRELFMQNYKEALIENWKNDEHLQKEFPNVNNYLDGKI